MRQRIISLVSVLSFVFIFTGYAEAIWLVDFVSKECWVETIEYYPSNEDDFDQIAYHTYDDRKLDMVVFEDRYGNINKVEKYYYDNGELKRIEDLKDFNNQAEDNIIQVRYFSYNNSKVLQKVEYWDNREESGNKIQIEELFYDNEGILEYKVFKDAENIEIINAVQYFDYDDGGKLKKVEELDHYKEEYVKRIEDQNFSYNPDGTVKSVEKIEYMDNGTVTSTAEFTWECVSIDDGSGSGGGSGGSSTSGCFIGTFF